eukprot:768137-Hanusia_phi.AAC.21
MCPIIELISVEPSQEGACLPFKQSQGINGLSDLASSQGQGVLYHGGGGGGGGGDDLFRGGGSQQRHEGDQFILQVVGSQTRSWVLRLVGIEGVDRQTNLMRRFESL